MYERAPMKESPHLHQILLHVQLSSLLNMHRRAVPNSDSRERRMQLKLILKLLVYTLFFKNNISYSTDAFGYTVEKL